MKVPFLDLKSLNLRFEDAFAQALRRVLDSGWFIQGRELDDLISYVQSLGGKAADARVAQLKATQAEVMTAWNKSYEDHLAQIKSMVPESWKELKSAVPPTQRSLLHGKQIFVTNCVGCHGQYGDSRGPASQLL